MYYSTPLVFVNRKGGNLMNRAKNDNEVIADLRPYILSALIEAFGDHCAECLEWSERYEIDHLAYGDKTTIYDLQLLCKECHRAKTGTSNDHYLSYGRKHCETCRCGD